MLIADSPPPYTSTAVTYRDGAVAEARSECAVLDLCATISLPDGDVMRIYNKGAGKCQPFVLHLVRTHGETVLVQSELVTATTETPSKYTDQNTPQPAPASTKRPRFAIQRRAQCAQFKNTYYTFDEGRIRMGVFLAKDGALFVQFAPPK